MIHLKPLVSSVRRQIKLGEKIRSETVTIGSLEATRAASEFSNEIFRTRESRIEQCTVFYAHALVFQKFFVSLARPGNWYLAFQYQEKKNRKVLQFLYLHDHGKFYTAMAILEWFSLE